jgi:hypothetical protein
VNREEGDRIAGLVLQLVRSLVHGELEHRNRLHEPTGTGYLEPDVAVHVHNRSDRKVG